LAKNVARGSLLGMLGQGWHMVTAFLLYAFLARRLGPSYFGQWRVVLSLLAWFEVFVTSALVRVATKEIGERPRETVRLSRAAYAGQALLAAAVFAAVELAAVPIARLLSDVSLAPLIRIAALDIPLYAMLMIASGIVLGAQRYERQAVAWLVYATAKAGLIALLVAAGFSLPGALVGNALSSLVGFAALVSRPGRLRMAVRELAPLAWGMLVASLPFLALALVEGVGNNVDLWLVSAVVANRAAVGLYASAAVLAEVPVFLFLGLNRVIFASVVRARADGDCEGADAYATAAVRTAMIVTVAAVALAASVGRQAIDLVYSAAYAGAFLPLVLLMTAGMGRTVRATCTEVLMATGKRGSALAILGATVALEIVAVAVLAGRFGLTGAAAGTAASAGVAAIWAGVALRSATGRRPLATLARSTAAAMVVGGGLVLTAPSPLLLVVAVPVALAVYIALLHLFGEFSAEDRASIRASMGRRADA
jgi:O-antigen/teichoic acid export membrane protein